MKRHDSQNLMVEISKDTHKKLKTLAIIKGKPMRLIVEELITALLCKEKLNEPAD